MKRSESSKGLEALEEFARLGAKLRDVARASVELDRPGRLGRDAVHELGTASDRFDESFNGLDSRPLWRDLLDSPSGGAPRRRRGIPVEFVVEVRESLSALLGAVHLMRESDLEPLDRACLCEVFDDQTIRLAAAVDRILCFVHKRRKRASVLH
jgi:hypothetical protein